MKIVADKSIPLLAELFGPMADILCLLPGRQIRAEHLADAEVLLVRSVTPVDETLLDHTPVRFIGSCTIGTDHLDTDCLDRRGIIWANAPGCNANAVVQYALSAMAATRADWLTKTVAVIGCGNVGKRLLQCLTRLGVRCVGYDPLLSLADNPWRASLEQALEADIISCHTPLTQSGPFPTYHMLGAEELARLQPGTVLINAGRGAMIHQQALKQRLRQQDLQVVLDVWEQEPDIDTELLSLVTIATPHIAGYSLEGRQRGTWMVYWALQRFLADSSPKRSSQKWPPQKQDLPSSDEEKIYLFPEPRLPASPAQQFNELLLAIYDIRRDGRVLGSGPPGQQSMADYFDQLRQHYPVRREYSHFIYPDWTKKPPLKNWLATLQQLPV